MRFKKRILLLAAALLFSLLCALALGEGETTPVNTLAAGETKVECVFLARATEKKSDAALILVTTPEGLEIFLMDGGSSTAHVYSELAAMRRAIMEENGLGDQIKNKQYKLEFSLLITHFHGDHVNELISNILPTGLFSVKAAYYPPCSALDQTGTYDNTKNGDFGKRSAVLSALDNYHPNALKCELAFGETLVVPTRAGEIKLFAPSEDWGTPEMAAYTTQIYYLNNPVKARTDVPTAVVNANSMWIRAEHAGASVLFTGDTMKKLYSVHDEAFDRMIAFYGDAVRANVVKYPHHGLSRNAASEALAAHLLIPGDNACVVLTGYEASTQAGLALDRLSVPWTDINGGNVTFTLTAQGALRTDAE